MTITPDTTETETYTVDTIEHAHDERHVSADWAQGPVSLEHFGGLLAEWADTLADVSEMEPADYFGMTPGTLTCSARILESAQGDNPDPEAWVRFYLVPA